MTRILHRSIKSPYAQKAMLLMGYLDQDYLSFIAPKGLPRPIEEKLVGNYCRRIPILQIGADMYCDTELIIRVMAERTGATSLVTYPSGDEAQTWIEKIETQGASTLIGAFSPWELIKGYFRNMPPNHAWKFITDRAKLARKLGSEGPRLSTEEKEAEARAYLEELDRHLQGRRFMLSEEEPTSVDFTAFTMIYYHNIINGLRLAERLSNLRRWFDGMEAFGTGRFTEIAGQETLNIAFNATPTPIPERLLESDRIGQGVSYRNKGFQAAMNEGVEGIVMGEDDNTIVLRRENADVGIVHVHFPKLRY